MSFTVTMKCSKCDQVFVGQDEHLVDAVTHMVESAAAGKHVTKRLNQELEALSGKAEEVNIVGGILDVLGLEPGQVHIIDDPGQMTQQEFHEFIQKHRDGDKPDE